MIVKTDCFEAVQGGFDKIVHECRALLLQVKNKGVHLKFIKSSANNVTPVLAKYSYSIDNHI